MAGNEFAGKTVMPFYTSGSSGIGGSAERLAELASSGDWLEGERFSSGAGDEAAEWAAGLGLQGRRS
ncbi:flavodoxin [Thermophilibacter provencensis]|uniref:flavodoxin n=1 Tax=Thermophilibacter provencensis TaxID=1852386 RepID=UPI0025A4749E|nr:flavodoxin [Thermophilibacter provencensis]